ncbi:MAG: HAMP domain-containing sensor histidine kinase [Anaerolineaceae bacterium]
MKPRYSFRGFIILLFIGGMIPLLVMVGLVVYRLQQSYLVNESQNRLIDFVQSGVKQYSGDADLTVLAVNLGERLRVLGADMFIQNAAGNPVPPSLGTGPWMDNAAHQSVRNSKTSMMQIIHSGSDARMVYLAAISDPTGKLLGSVEASLPMSEIIDQLAALRRWLILITAIASGLAVLLAIHLSGIITRPLKSLIQSAEKVRQGNLDTRAEIPGVQELGQLAITYNQMLDRISEDMKQQVMQADNMRRFAADASHELRSPLSVFRNSVELLEKASNQNDHTRCAEIQTILHKEADSMTVLVENLLLLARLDQPGEGAANQLHPEIIHPFPLLEEVYERSKILTQGQQLELLWTTADNPPIWADREMLRRALNNLVENAIAHTPVGKKITLSLEVRNDRCCFVISDQGSGIAPDEFPKIFERFYRSDESRNRQVPGTGLGLAIVAAIVRAHKGEIQVESELGKGTCFRLLFSQMDQPAIEP